MEPDEKLRLLQPVLGDKAGRLHAVYTASEWEERQRLDETFDILLRSKLGKDHQNRILLPAPTPCEVQGEYPLGQVIYPEQPYCDFGLREDEWIKHVLIAGMSGAGKTNTSFVILDQLLRHQKPFLVFDWKRNYRDLLQHERFKDTVVFTVGKNISPFRFNPLIPPPGVDPREWLAKLIDVICHAFFTGHGVEYILINKLDELFNRRGIYIGSNDYPTFEEAYQELKRTSFRGRKMLWHHSALRVLSDLSFPGGLGNVVNCRQQIPIDRLLEQNVILELDALSDSDKTFFTEALLLWIYEYRKNNGKREDFQHAVVIEEGHHILSRAKEKHLGGETIMETSLRQIREFGESIIVLDQEPSKLSESIKANTSTKIIFTLGNGKDIADVARSMNLEREHQAYLDWLEVGQAIVKVKGRIKEPILVKFPLFEIQKGKIRDYELKNLMKDSSLVSASKRPLSGNLSKSLSPSHSDILPPTERIMLTSIAKNPFWGTTKRYRKLGFSDYEGNKTKESLIAKRLVIPVTVNRLKLLELTEQGLSALQQQGIRIHTSKRYGSLEHQYWKHRVKQHYLAKGYKVEEEKDNIDLVISKDGKQIAVEIETGESDINANIDKALRRYPTLFIIPTSQAAQVQVMNLATKLPALTRKRIRIIPTKDFT
jgi:hypothetical protein